ncbi:MAG: hypothetical protein HY046_01800 [Acidobacteria bacterium]|nr:hypothetical protein [Acidobacteriota bacterium]
MLKWSAVPDEFNYFNYFTEIEEHFWRNRGANILISPLDWAILETWQKAGIPLEVVLRGIDRAFESYARSRRGAAGRTMKSLAYCVDAVLDAAGEAREASAGQGPQPGGRTPAGPTFSADELRTHLQSSASELESTANKCKDAQSELAVRLRETAARLRELLPLLDSPAAVDLEDLERRLTVLEDKLFSALTTFASNDSQLSIRTEMDRSLAPYRSRMNAAQLAMVEKQFLQKRLLEQFRLPRLSLFYLKEGTRK